MLPDPLHPAVVHFPLVLATLLPLFALGSLWAISRAARPRRAWALTVVLAFAVVGSAWFALETGEREEDAVEAVVPAGVIHDHEEAAERFLLLAAVLAVVAAGGLAGGTLGTAARGVATVGSFVVLAAGVQTGSLGGELVYEHGAAAAYASPPGEAEVSLLPEPRGPDEVREDGGRQPDPRP